MMKARQREKMTSLTSCVEPTTATVRRESPIRIPTVVADSPETKPLCKGVLPFHEKAHPYFTEKSCRIFPDVSQHLRTGWITICFDCCIARCFKQAKRVISQK
jgi:hypothetical protein